MPRVRSKWPQQQHTGRINRGDRLTKGLRHVVVPGLAGNDNGLIRDLVDTNCYMGLYASAGYNQQLPASPPDIAIYQHSALSHWVLWGPSLIWTPGSSFSFFIRYAALVGDTAVWSVGHYSYGVGWELLNGSYGGGPTAIFGQFGQWVVGGIDSFNMDSGYGGDPNQWVTVAFTYDGTNRRVRVYKDGVLGVDRPYAGNDWTSMGGGGGAVGGDYWQSWKADYAPDLGSGYTKLSHIYMWEAELQPADVMRLTANPAAIFTSPRPTLMMTGLTLPDEIIEPPEPTVGSPGQQHILGAI